MSTQARAKINHVSLKLKKQKLKGPFLLQRLTSKPPPKIQNSTGSLAPAAVPSGRATVIVRQSSDCPVTVWTNGRFAMDPSVSSRKFLLSVETTCWGQAPAGPVASKTPKDSVRRTGGFIRNGPRGGFAYGIPPNDSTPFLTLPSIVPAGTTAVAVLAARRSGAPVGDARAKVAQTRETHKGWINMAVKLAEFLGDRYRAELGESKKQNLPASHRSRVASTRINR